MSHGHGHLQNGFPQELLAPEAIMSQHNQKQLQAGAGLPQTKSVARAVGPEHPAWNGRYEL